jgi:hypothetical protein
MTAEIFFVRMIFLIACREKRRERILYKQIICFATLAKTDFFPYVCPSL